MKTRNVFLLLLIMVLSLCLVGCGAQGPQGTKGDWIPMGPQGEYDMNSESFLELQETGYINTEKNNKLNVSLDSSTAAYSNIRKNIVNNYNIHKDSVNIEQMLNYFNYSYSNNSDEQLQSFLEIADCPWNDNKLLSVAIKAKDYQLENVKPNNFVFLLDVSGSMNANNKLPLMIEAFKLLIDNLNENDRVSIVTYAGSDDVLLDGGFGYEKTKISAIISDLYAYGSTAGSKGITTAYKLASKYYIEGGNNRVFLATDGDFNVGLSSTQELEKFISEKRETGVYLSLFGFGSGNLKSDIMDTLAQAGNGNYYYIDSILEAQKIFISELGGTLETVAKDCKVQIEFNKDIISKYRIIGYENKILTDEEFENSETDAGEIGAGHTTVCLVEVVLKEDYELKESLTKCILKYKDVKDNEIEKTIVNELKEITSTPSNDFIFQSAIAEFGLLLRNSQFKDNANYNNLISRIENDNVLNDIYRKEFLELVKLARDKYSTNID